MSIDLSHYDWVRETVGTRAITLLLVRGATTAEVAHALDVDLSAPAADGVARYALVDVTDGILVSDPTGERDPDPAGLAALSRGGRRAAVARASGEGRVRFGCAQDGVSLFDVDDLPGADRTGLPRELVDVLEAAASTAPDDEFVAALATSEAWTGLHLTPTAFEALAAAGHHPVRGA